MANIKEKVQEEQPKTSSSQDYLEFHQIEVVDFAIQGHMERTQSIKTTLGWNLKAKYTRRSKFSQWLETV